MRGQRRCEQMHAKIKKEAAPTTEKPVDKEEAPKHTEDALLKLTNSKLKNILSGFDGAPSGAGNTKSELVALILDAQE